MARITLGCSLDVHDFCAECGCMCHGGEAVSPPSGDDNRALLGNPRCPHCGWDGLTIHLDDKITCNGCDRVRTDVTAPPRPERKKPMSAKHDTTAPTPDTTPAPKRKRRTRAEMAGAERDAAEDALLLYQSYRATLVDELSRIEARATAIRAALGSDS